jgi:ESCRT-I complex subunit VPS28
MSRWPDALDKSLSEINLYENSKERKALENCEVLYSIITATEHLERAYVQDAITNQEYTTECNKLISQFKIAEKAALGQNSMTTETFMKIYQMDCPRAAYRLLRMGVPEPLRNTDNSSNVAACAAEAMEKFVTTMDGVNLKELDVDVLQPQLSELMNALVQIPDTPDDWTPKLKVEKWLVQLNSMRAWDRIDNDDARQLLHDLESARLEFTQYLKTKR